MELEFREWKSVHFKKPEEYTVVQLAFVTDQGEKHVVTGMVNEDGDWVDNTDAYMEEYWGVMFFMFWKELEEYPINQLGY